jgi:peptidoglycan hydrolase CwlO-like protein
MIVKNKKGKDVTVKNVSELFGSDKGKMRIELFGSRLSTKKFNLNKVLENCDNNIKEFNRQLSNLKLLKDELKKLVAEQKAKELRESVDKMSNEDAQVLLEQLKAKLGQ